MNGQQLKNSILQMAVQGKLVPQDPNDEPASVLLEKIRKEKKKLIKEGKIKKEKNPSYIFRGSDNLPYEKVGNNELVCIADEAPFEIPESWEWVRLKELCQLLDGEKRNNISYVVMDAKYLRGKTRSTFINAGKFVSAGEHMILVDGENSGEVFVAPVDGYMGSTFKQLWIAPILCKDYVLLFINLYRIPLKNRKTGAAIPHLNKNLFLNLLLPVPPLTEQKRIVEQYRTLNPLAEKYGCLKKDIEYLNTRFPDQLKKSILQEAIQGKLVPQDPNDEPASVLLERIRAEKQRLVKEGKIKKDKHESIIFRRDNSYYEKLDGIERCIDDEIPFEVPDSWEWTRMSSIAALVTKGTTPRGGNVAYLSEGVGFLRAENVAGLDRIDLSKLSYIDESTHTGYLKRSILKANDVLITIAGTLGRTAIVKEEYLPLNANQAVAIIRTVCPKYINLKYLVYVLNAPAVQDILTTKKKITAIPNLTLEIISDSLVPIPPLNEQHRIVKKAEDTLSHIGNNKSAQ